MTGLTQGEMMREVLVTFGVGMLLIGFVVGVICCLAKLSEYGDSL